MEITPDESEATGDWKEPGVFLVAEGVYRVPLPLPSDGLAAVNVYLIVDSDSITVIDAGWADEDSRALLVSALRALDATPEAISQFLVTHMHRDHLEQAIAVRRDFGTRVLLGRGEFASIEISRDRTREPMAEQLDWLRELGAGALAEQVVAVAGSRRAGLEFPDEWLDGGDVRLEGGRVLAAVSTPGHTRGHFVFHDGAAGLLFAGDHVLPTITPSIGFEAPLSDDPLGDFLGSLALVRERPDARLLAAHGPVAPSVHARIDELVDHHATRLDLCLAALTEGCVTGLDVAGRLPWTRRERTLAELDVFNSMLAISETGAHLSLLVAQGRASSSLDDGVRVFALA